MGGSGGGHDLEFWDVATWFLLPYGNWCRDPIFSGCDLGCFGGAEGRSRHGIGVTTWLGRPGGHDLEAMSRPGLGLGKGRRSRLAPTTWGLCA